MTSYYSNLVTLITDIIICDIAKLIALYVTPVNPTSIDIGKYDLPIEDSAKIVPEDYMQGLGESGNLDWVISIISNPPAWIPRNYMRCYINYCIKGAAKGYHTKVMKYLRNRGADIHSAVTGAASGGHMDLVTNLLKEGADPTNALIGACESDSISIAKVAIGLGARAKRIRPPIENMSTNMMDLLCAHGMEWDDLAMRACNNIKLFKYAASKVNDIDALLRKIAPLCVPEKCILHLIDLGADILTIEDTMWPRYNPIIQQLIALKNEAYKNIYVRQ